MKEEKNGFETKNHIEYKLLSRDWSLCCSEPWPAGKRT